MRFWDSSAIVPLLVDEDASTWAEARLREDDVIVAWWGTSVECVSALARREREGEIDSEHMSRAAASIAELAGAWIEVAPTARVREIAHRLLRVHDLRAADALQLAAAVRIADETDEHLPLVTLDARFTLAASREGFPVLSR